MYICNLSFEIHIKITKCWCSDVKLRFCVVCLSKLLLLMALNQYDDNLNALMSLHNPTSYLNASNNKRVSSVTARQAPEEEHETSSDTSHSPRLRKLV